MPDGFKGQLPKNGAARKWPRMCGNGSAMIAETKTGVVDAILEVGRQRKAVLDQLRAALQSGDNSQALNLARQLCGLQNEESTRTNPRLN
jgi:hypothetical protein